MTYNDPNEDCGAVIQKQQQKLKNNNNKTGENIVTEAVTGYMILKVKK